MTKMTQKLTSIGHRTVSNNDQSPYRIVSYKRPRNVYLSVIRCVVGLVCLQVKYLSHIRNKYFRLFSQLSKISSYYMFSQYSRASRFRSQIITEPVVILLMSRTIQYSPNTAIIVDTRVRSREAPISRIPYIYVLYIGHGFSVCHGMQLNCFCPLIFYSFS